MKRTAFFLSAALLGLALFGVAGGCSSPEGFCESWVADRCEVLSGCCKNGSKYDHELCILSLSQSCQALTQVEDTHAGEVVFDSGAASTCLGSMDSCDAVTLSPEDAFDRQVACANVVTGFRPPGAACERDSQCESTGEFAQCWEGTGGVGGGVCAAVVLTGDATCGFSIETNELTTCNVEEFCDSSEFVPNPDDPPSKRALEFKGKCKPFLDNGGICFDPTQMAGQFIPCKSGLYCDLSGGTGVCTPQKGEGDACNGGNECKSPLVCDGPGANQVCTKSGADGDFCFQPSVCGDNQCDASELTTCPQDCGGNDCGDGFCNVAGGEPADCPIDCCGDGSCDFGEDAVCPGDCGGGI